MREVLIVIGCVLLITNPIYGVGLIMLVLAS